MVKDSISFENAMFGEYDDLLAYYKPTITALANRFSDRTRATVNFGDIEQTMAIALWRCWCDQRRGHTSTGKPIANFDNFVKTAFINDVKTLLGKEFCGKRCSTYVHFFSDMEFSHGEEGARDITEIVDFGEHVDDESEFARVVGQIESVLPSDCRAVFSSLLKHVEGGYDHRQSLRSRHIQKRISEDLGVSLAVVEERSERMLFILSGYKDTVLNPRYGRSGRREKLLA